MISNRCSRILFRLCCGGSGAMMSDTVVACEAAIHLLICVERMCNVGPFPVGYLELVNS